MVPLGVQLTLWSALSVSQVLRKSLGLGVCERICDCYNVKADP